MSNNIELETGDSMLMYQLLSLIWNPMDRTGTLIQRLLERMPGGTKIFDEGGFELFVSQTST